MLERHEETELPSFLPFSVSPPSLSYVERQPSTKGRHRSDATSGRSGLLLSEYHTHCQFVIFRCCLLRKVSNPFLFGQFTKFLYSNWFHMRLIYCSSRTANHFCSCSSLFTPQIRGAAASRISGVSEGERSREVEIVAWAQNRWRSRRRRRHPDSCSAFYVSRLATGEEIVNPFRKLCRTGGEGGEEARCSLFL